MPPGQHLSCSCQRQGVPLCSCHCSHAPALHMMATSIVSMLGTPTITSQVKQLAMAAIQIASWKMLHSCSARTTATASA